VSVHWKEYFYEYEYKYLSSVSVHPYHVVKLIIYFGLIYWIKSQRAAYLHQ